MGLLDGFRKGTPEQRTEIKESDKQLKALERELEDHVRPQRLAYESALKQHELRVAEAENKLKGLENPLYGELISTMGNLFLFEHILFEGLSPTNYNTKTNGFGILLEGISVSVESAGEFSYIYFDEPHVGRRMLSFSGTRDPEVRSFAIQIERAVEAENRFRRDLPRMTDAARAELEAVRNDTAALMDLWDAFQTAAAEWTKAPELAAARRRFEEANAALGRGTH